MPLAKLVDREASGTTTIVPALFGDLCNVNCWRRDARLVALEERAGDGAGFGSDARESRLMELLRDCLGFSV